MRSWGSNLADHVEPALQPLYERHRIRTERRWRIAWATILASLVPFALAMGDKYLDVPLQWPIATANLALCAFHFLAMVRSHRYMASVYDMAYAAHAEKLRQRASER